CLERAEVPSLAGLRVFFPRIQPVTARFQFSDHEDFDLSTAKSFRSANKRQSRPASKRKSSTRCHANESRSLTWPKQPQEISRPRAFAEILAPTKTSISMSMSASAPE